MKRGRGHWRLRWNTHAGKMARKSGGQGGIRTHGELPHTAFRVRRTRPLCDLSDGDYGKVESKLSNLPEKSVLWGYH